MATMATDLKQEKLKVAWTKFHARIADVRKKTRLLLQRADEKERNNEMEKLRKRIEQPQYMEKDAHAELATAWRRFIRRVDTIKHAAQKISTTYATPKSRT